MASTLNIALQNQTTSNTVYAYITGLALQHNNALFLLQSDGRSYYFPTQPPSIGSPLTQNCAIALGNPGSTRTVTIPQIAGGRIWFSIDSPLTFLLNPGPALVEPSVTNPSDPNINIRWGFCEFTFNAAQLYANISYVDFVGVPVAIALTNEAGNTKKVAGSLGFGVTMVGPVIIAFGSEAQKKRFLPRIANLDDWWCQGFSEPGSGSDLASLKTSAKRNGSDHYVVNGQKTWT